VIIIRTGPLKQTVNHPKLRRIPNQALLQDFFSKLTQPHCDLRYNVIDELTKSFPTGTEPPRCFVALSERHTTTRSQVGSEKQ